MSKRRSGSAAVAAASSAAAPRAQPVTLPAAQATLRQQNRTVFALAMTLMMAPAMGVPTEEMLQDTLKSMLVSFGTLIACGIFLWHQRRREAGPVWDGLLLLPISLMLYALGSMAWSHTYLAAGEAIRWFLFTLLLWLGTNTLTRDQVPRLFLGLHLGACFASLWTALQFWFAFNGFPQGPHPASTFVNRNFFAEFLVCTLPISLYLLVHARRRFAVTGLGLSLAFNLVAMMMTGTRSALIALLAILLAAPLVLRLYWRHLPAQAWPRQWRLRLAAGMLGTVLVLGLIPTGDPVIQGEVGQVTALDQALKRSASMAKSSEYTQGSFSIRAVMWMATLRMIGANPVSGVGAGAWEVQIPLYQEPGTQLETDFYAHNEFLQLPAEYGAVGWTFLLLLSAYLVGAAWRIWRDRSEAAQAEGPLRGLTLTSLLALMVVSNAGFPWRMATTGALFALLLAVLLASDRRLAAAKASQPATAPRWKPAYARVGLGLTAACLVLAGYIAQQAALCESLLVRGVKLALTISQSGRPDDPRLKQAREDMLRLMREGIAINPHYRKITSMAADELAMWGDWKNAIWVWDSVLESRPYVVAIMANMARGYMELGNDRAATDYLVRATKLQPSAPAVRAMQVMMLYHLGHDKEAAQFLHELFDAKQADNELLFWAYKVGLRAPDYPLAIQALQLRIDRQPKEAAKGWLLLGDLYNSMPEGSATLALDAYRNAVRTAPPGMQHVVAKQIPAQFQDKLR